VGVDGAGAPNRLGALVDGCDVAGEVVVPNRLGAGAAEVAPPPKRGAEGLDTFPKRP
jgi:hypothetical protein